MGKGSRVKRHIGEDNERNLSEGRERGGTQGRNGVEQACERNGGKGTRAKARQGVE